MTHFAQITNGVVTQVIVAEQDFIDTLPDKDQWRQTSYNTRANVHYGPDNTPDGGVALRGNYAGIGSIYDSVHDVFYSPQPFPSWQLDNNTWTWRAPTECPASGGPYRWNEDTLTWIK